MITKTIKQMIRTFYPVGQGAFYRERFTFDNNDVFNIVYDCGTKTQQGSVNIDSILNNWNIDEPVDILFISHFHKDHISKIKDLATKTRPKMVVMPYLSDEDKKYYKIGIIYSSIASNSFDTKEIIEDIKFINNPNKALNRNRIENICYVAKSYEVDRINDNVIKVTEGNLFDKTDKIKILQNFKATWVLDTFVSSKFDSKQIIEEFEEKICKISELNNEEKVKEILTTKIDDIKRIYKENLNEKSLVLYSGPLSIIINGAYKHVMFSPFYISRQVGCLYTGDYNASSSKFYNEMMDHYKDYKKDIGVLQLPHHGSNNGFNDGFLKMGCVYVACAGEKNQHRHPSYSVVNKIIGRKKKLYIVTENSKELSFRIEKV